METANFKSQLAWLFQQLEAEVVGRLSRKHRRVHMAWSSSLLSPYAQLDEFFKQLFAKCCIPPDSDIAICAQLYCKVVSGDGSITVWFAILFSCRLIVSALTSTAFVHTPLCALIKGFHVVSRAAIHELTIAEDGNDDAGHKCTMSRIVSWSDLEHILAIIQTSLLLSQRNYGRVQLLSDAQVDHVSMSFLTAFLSALDSNNNGGTASCNIVYRHAVGLPFESLLVLEDTLAMDIPIPFALLNNDNISWTSTDKNDKKAVVEEGNLDKNSFCEKQESSAHTGVATRNLVVAMFENSLEMLEMSSTIAIDINVTLQDQCNTTTTTTTTSAPKIVTSEETLKSVELAYLDRVVQLFRRSNVTLVACQKRVHPYLIRLLNACGILCLQRLSIRYCGALQRLCGARQLVSLPMAVPTSLSNDKAFDIDTKATLNTHSVLDPDCLGYLGQVNCRMIYGRRYVVATAGTDTPTPSPTSSGDGPPRVNNYTVISQLAQARRAPIATIVITAPCERLCEHMEGMLEEAKRTLMSLFIASSSVSTTASATTSGDEMGNGTDGTARVLRGNGQWQRLLARRLHEKLLNTTTKTTRTSADHSSNNLTINSTVATVVDRYDIQRSITLFLDCLDVCGTMYGDVDSFDDEENEDNGYETSVDRGIGLGIRGRERIDESNSNSDCDRDSSKRYWEPFLPCQNALLLAVEAATCILSLDTTTSPIVVALPIETRK